VLIPSVHDAMHPFAHCHPAYISTTGMQATMAKRLTRDPAFQSGRPPAAFVRKKLVSDPSLASLGKIHTHKQPMNEF